MPGTKVIIVGCGIAGPVLALLLKQKGYEPVIYERGPRAPDAGLSLLLQPNGLQVLALIPGLVERLPGKALAQRAMYSIVPTDERLLARSDTDTAAAPVGVRRPAFLALLADTAIAAGIPVHFDTPVVGIEHAEAGDAATVRFKLPLGTSETGTDTAPLVVGCDGLHSSVRAALFGRETPTFTGLTQTGGTTPVAFTDRPPTMFNFYGDNLHVIAYPISATGYSWAFTQREPEAKETWRAMDDAAQDAVRNGPFSELPFEVGELIRNGEKITKYGLYDRPELQSWHKGRVVLIGDAAHPTSPHLGQGANQAFEDAAHLVRLLTTHHPHHAADGSLPLETLERVFGAFEAARVERTAALVRAARKAGELRVVAGIEQARARNEVVAREWAAAADVQSGPGDAAR